jgi:hypothetical protein
MMRPRGLQDTYRLDAGAARHEDFAAPPGMIDASGQKIIAQGVG